MEERQDREASEVEFPEVEVPEDGVMSVHLDLEDLSRVKLPLTANLGHTEMKVREILELKVGSVVQLEKMAGEMKDIHLADRHIARGEVVVTGDSLHVRLSEILGLNEIPIR